MFVCSRHLFERPPPSVLKLGLIERQRVAPRPISNEPEADVCVTMAETDGLGHRDENRISVLGESDFDA